MRISGRKFVCGLWLAAVCAGELSAEPAAPVISRTAVVHASGRVDDFRVMQSPEGAVYLFLIDDGQLRILRGDGDGEFAAFWPEGLPAEAGGGARDLRLFEFPPLQYAAFVGREGPSEAIYVLGLDFMGDLRWYPAPELRGFAGVAGYRLTASPHSGAAVFVLADGQLRYSAAIGAEDRMPLLRLITNSNERIDADAVNGGFEVLRETAYPLGRGWFTVPGNGGQELSFFTLGEDLLLRRDRIGFFAGDLQVDAGIDGEGKSYFALVHGEDVAFYRGDGGAFLREQNPAAMGGGFAGSGGDGGDAGDAGGEEPPEAGWLLLFAVVADPVTAWYLDPASGELAAGEYRAGIFDVRERRRFEPPEAAPPGTARYRASRAINGKLYVGVHAGEEIAIYRFLMPGTSAAFDAPETSTGGTL
jgi:hypothetical protein